MDSYTLMQLILDSNKVIDAKDCVGYESPLRALERQSITLFHSSILNGSRDLQLSLIGKVAPEHLRRFYRFKV